MLSTAEHAMCYLETVVSILIPKSRININEILTCTKGHNCVINDIPNYFYQPTSIDAGRK